MFIVWFAHGGFNIIIIFLILLCAHSEVDVRVGNWDAVYRARLDSALRDYRKWKKTSPDLHLNSIATEHGLSFKHLVIWLIRLVGKYRYSVSLCVDLTTCQCI